MQRNQRSLSLLALAIGLVPLAIGCPADTGATTDEVSTTSGTTSGGSETLADSSGGGGTSSGSESSGATTDEVSTDSSGTGGGGVASCEEMAALFVNTPATTETADCDLSDGSATTCCTFTFSSGLVEDGPYCPASRTSAPPYGLSVYDGATNPGLRPFNGDYLDDIEADGYDPMVDENGNTNIVTGLGGGPPADGSNCLAIDQDPALVIEVNVPLFPTMAAAPNQLGEVENLGVSVMGVPGTGDPPSATMGPQMGGPGGGKTDAINVPSIGSCGAHPDPAGYLHDHFVPQVMNAVLEANGIQPGDVECTTYEQNSTALYGFAKDGFPIYASRDDEGSVPEDLDECSGHTQATPQFPDGTYHYHASESVAPNFMTCLSGVPVEQSFRYE